MPLHRVCGREVFGEAVRVLHGSATGVFESEYFDAKSFAVPSLEAVRRHCFYKTFGM